METHYTIIVHHSQSIQTVNLDNFDAANRLVQEMNEMGIRCECYEVKNGRKHDMYTGEDIEDRYNDYLKELGQ